MSPWMWLVFVLAAALTILVAATIIVVSFALVRGVWRGDAVKARRDQLARRSEP